MKGNFHARFLGGCGRANRPHLPGAFSHIMPSIELICVQQHEPSLLPELPFAICSESVLRSHRSPQPLFQSDFDELRGCIYHLGSPFCDDAGYRGPFFAYELLSECCRVGSPARFLEFAPEFLPGIKILLSLLLRASPVGLVIFTTDWQFGPHPARRYHRITERTFWQRHANRKLHLNALYAIGPNA